MVSTIDATSNGNSATLNGEVSECVGKVIEYGFYWGEDETTPHKLIMGSANSVTVFSKELADLKAGTYYFKAFATNKAGDGFGKVNKFEIKATDVIKVLLNGQELAFDVPPLSENDRILVPIRSIFEALGADVQWNSEAKMVTAVKNSIKIKLVIDGIAYKNGEQVALDVPAKIIKDRTMVPLRFISEAIGCQVIWEESTHTVKIIQ
ncbi:MAG: copper amine oxidase N-terminal domain-containing protein [Desulfitobacterium hafniense]|nr:copper amine oxidase N-terminal domain-containing protein [Desulfitobacterium hafniense]